MIGVMNAVVVVSSSLRIEAIIEVHSQVFLRNGSDVELGSQESGFPA